MGTLGGPWGPVGTHGNPWEPMGPMGNPWEPMGTHGDSWGPMGTHGDPCGPMGTHEAPRATEIDSGALDFFLEFGSWIKICSRSIEMALNELKFAIETHCFFISVHRCPWLFIDLASCFITVRWCSLVYVDIH